MKTVAMIIAALAVLSPASASAENFQYTISEQEMWNRVWPSVRIYMDSKKEAATSKSTYQSRTVIDGPYGRSIIRSNSTTTHPN